MSADPSNHAFHRTVRSLYKAACYQASDGDPSFQGTKPGQTIRIYHDDFTRSLGNYEASVSFVDVMYAAQQADIVYVGDFHPLRLAKDTFCRIVSEGVSEGASPSRSPVIFLEEFEAYHERFLDSYIKGNIDSGTLWRKTGGYNRYKLNRTWGGILGIVDYAREHRIPVHGIDHVDDSLRKRTTQFAEHVKRELKRDPSKQFFVLAGEYHLADDKLPALLRDQVGSSVTIFQSPDEMFWQLLPHGIMGEAEAIQTSTGAYCLLNTNPLFRTMVQKSAEEYKGTRPSKEELLLHYKHALLAILCEALGLKVNGIDVEEIDHSSLEKLVYGTADEATVRTQIETWNDAN